MGSFAEIGARMRLVQSMLDNADLDSGPKDRGQLEAIDPWRTFLCFNDPRIRWSLQREAYAGLLAEGVNFSFRDGGVITAAGVAVDAASQGLRVSTEGIEWGKASGVDLYIAAQRLEIKDGDASKQFGKHAEPFLRTASLVRKMLDRNPNLPFLNEWEEELVPSLFADRSLRGLRRSSMRVAADSMVEQASRDIDGFSYQNPKWIQVQPPDHKSEGFISKEDAHRWRSGWRDMCSEWFVLMLSNHVLRAHDEATAFVIECKRTDRVLPEPLRCLERHLKEIRDRQLEMG